MKYIEVYQSRVAKALSAAVFSAVMLVSASASAVLINNSGGTGAGGQATTTGTPTTQILPQSGIFDHGFFRSGDGVGSETNSANGAQNVIIQPHNAWAAPNVTNGNTEGAFWISHDVGSGANGNVTVPITSSCSNGLSNCDSDDISVSFFESITASAGDTLGFWVYADDTARVLLSGPGVLTDLTGDGAFVDDLFVQISVDPNFTQGTCAVGPIGCQANEFSFIEVQGLLAGEYTVRIDTYQTSGGSNANGANPFGVLYSGGLSSVNAVSVPEPGALALFAFGLAGLGFAARRRIKA